MKKMGIGHFGITQASLAFLTHPRGERHGRRRIFIEEFMSNASSVIVSYDIYSNL